MIEPPLAAPTTDAPTPGASTIAQVMRARLARLALLGVLAWHSRTWIGDPAGGPQPAQWLLHGVELAIHETGHLLFLPLGDTLHILGGSLFQLVVPVVFAIAFWRRGDRFGAAVSAWWLALGMWDVAIYVADARAQMLPLVGGGEHDWWMLLDRWHRLENDVHIARTLRDVGSVLAIVSLVVGGLFALRDASTADESGRMPNDVSRAD